MKANRSSSPLPSMMKSLKVSNYYRRPIRNAPQAETSHARLPIRRGRGSTERSAPVTGQIELIDREFSSILRSPLFLPLDFWRTGNSDLSRSETTYKSSANCPPDSRQKSETTDTPAVHPRRESGGSKCGGAPIFSAPLEPTVLVTQTLRPTSHRPSHNVRTSKQFREVTVYQPAFGWRVGKTPQRRPAFVSRPRN